jgi:uncharacterized alkaline shock family protein YloU
MKIKLFDRLLLTILTLIIILLSLILLSVALQIIPAADIADLLSEVSYGWPAIILGVISLVLFLAGIRLLVAGYARNKPLSALLANTDLGVIRISINTLDTLTQKAVRHFKEVKEVKSVVLADPEGVRVQLKISVLPEVVMPELSRNIQEKVKEYVEALSGIQVREVQIYIDNLSVEKQARVD